MTATRGRGDDASLAVETRPERPDPAQRIVMYDPGSFLPYYIDHLCRHLARVGCKIRVISSPPLFESVDVDDQYQVDWLFFPFLRGFGNALLRRHRRLRHAVKALAYPLGILRTWLALRRGTPGVLHVQWAPIPELDTLLLQALASRHWRIVYTAHDPPPRASHRLRYGAYRRLLGASDRVIVHTAQQAREIIDGVPEARTRVRIIPHGGTTFPLPTTEERRQCRRFLKIGDDRQLLLFFGQIKPYKGLPYLLAAMPRVISQFPRTQLLIAGEPLMSLRPLERQIDELGLRNHVSLQPVFVPEANVPRYLRAADLLIAPYVNIGASGVVVLAQGHGLPVVATRVGGLPEFIEPDRCGLVVPPRAPAPLADAICLCLSDPNALTEMGRRGWQRLARVNQWSGVADQTLALYRDVPVPDENRRGTVAAASHA